MPRRRLRRTTLMTITCLAVVIGIGFSRADLPIAVVVGVVLVVWLRSRLAVVLIIVGFIAGHARGMDMQKQLAPYQNAYDTKVTLIASAKEDAVYGKNGQITFAVGGVRIAETGQVLPGKISVSGFGENAVFTRDELRITGKLRPGLGSYQGFMSYAQISVIEHKPFWVYDARRIFSAAILSTLPEPGASFAMGLLVGQRATLPEEVNEHLKVVGLTHIIAASGYNLTILLHASKRVLGRWSKRLATWLTIAMIMIFVLMTGGGPSITRAAVVSILSIGIAYYGRRTQPLFLLAFVAAVTAYKNPLYVWGDPGWYLSFLAFYGVLVVAPIMQSLLPAICTRSVILAVGVESICAEIMSLPYILFVFGQMSFVGLVANMLVTALVPLAMLLGFIAGLAGLFLWPIAGWFAWPGAQLLTYMLDVAKILANLPYAYTNNVYIPLSMLVAWYGVVALLSWRLGFKDANKIDIINRYNERTQ